MTKVRPRSLLQVVLMGFVLVLMPLGGMIWHDSQALSHLGQLTSDEMERAVRDTRRATLLTTQAIDLERTLRRYAVLGDERILGSYQQQLARYRELLATHRQSIPDAAVYSDLEATLAWLDGLQDLRKARMEATSPNFTQFNELNQQLEVVTRSQVDEHVAGMRAAIAELRKEIWWVSGFVVGLSLLGAGAAATFVALLSRGRPDPVLLVLLGAAVTAACLSAVSAVTIRNQAALEVMRFWQVGSIGGRGLPLLLPSLPVLLTGAALTVWAGATLNTLAVGDDLATALGTRLGRTRAVLTVGAVLLAAGSVAVVGPIGFVGLVVPHIVRLLMGPDYRVVIAGSVLLGPVLLLTADIIGRVVMPPAEISAGLVVLLLGAPVLVALVRRSVHA